MTSDWTARPEPFSLAFGEQVTRELVQKLYRCPMNEAAKKSEVREYARTMIEIYRKQKVREGAEALEG